MTKRPLYIFNPEHDLALASGETNYMPPTSARRMAAELALLPMWYALEEEAAVLAPSAYNIDFLKVMKELLGVNVQLVTEPEIAAEKELEFSPWGWDPALRKRLLSLEASPLSLPSEEYLSTLRKYSHRMHAVELLLELQLNEYFCGQSFYLKTLEECKTFVEEREACLLKAPLSGSGKGLNWCKGIFTTFISGWCTRVICSQGGVVGESIYDKVEDFAMEFRSNGHGEVVFAGYSQFYTGKSGMYESNLLASDAVIEHNLSAYIPLKELHRLRSVLEQELSLLFGSVYTGYLGVDMMICHFSDSPVYRIHPCVEINLRMNMGVVARKFYDNYVHSGAIGTFRIMYHPSMGEAYKEHERMSAAYPLIVEHGRIRSGYLSLVPVHSKSSYRVWVNVSMR